MTWSLIADRFVPLHDELALDLPTGEYAWLRTATAPAGAERGSWEDALEVLAASCHPTLGECLDGGPLGGARVFHAWQASRPLRAAPPRLAQRRLLVEPAQAYLAARGIVAAGAEHWHAVGARGRLVAIPPIVAPAAPAAAWSDDWWAVSWPQGADVARVVDAADECRTPGVTVLGVDAPHGCGLRRWIRLLARSARARGLVPVCADALRWLAALPRDGPAVWEDRTLLVIAVAGAWAPPSRHELAGLVIRLAGTGAQPHVVLDVVRAGRPRHAPFRVEPFSPERLVEAVWLGGRSRARRAVVRRLARESQGWAGRFLRALRRTWPGDGVDARHVEVVHESAPDYGTAWSPEGARSDSTSRRMARGRYRDAERSLRGAIGRSERRRDPVEVALRSLALARILVERLHTDEARRWIAQARGAAGAAPDVRAGIAVAVASGRLQVLDGEPALAEAELRTAVEAAAAAGDAGLEAEAQVALAECLRWQARLDESAQTAMRAIGLAPAGGVTWAAALDAAVAAHLAAGRIAAAGEVLTRTAGDVVPATGEAATHVRLARARAGLASGAGDRTWRGGTRRQRVEWTLWVAECAEARRRAWPARRLARLARVAAGWPALPRARLARLRGETPRGSEWLAALAARGVRLDAVMAGGSAGEGRGMVQDLVAIVRACQTADDPRVALERGAALVRERVRASGVAVLGSDASAPVLLAASGTWRPAAIASRVVEGGHAAGPEAGPHGLEAGAPVPFGPAVIGAVLVRWAGALPVDAREALEVLQAAAAAAAPSVRLALEGAAPAVAPPASAAVEILGTSDVANELRRRVAAAAGAPFPVLIQGESGVGKELVARAVHRGGARRLRAFCAINCAALTDELLEVELFGHAKGAFTGAVGQRPGLFEVADGGSLFLDEIGELSPRGQAKLLRAIQEGEIRRVGETAPRRVDVRILAATNRPLAAAAAEGLFRQDLFYRLDVVRLSVPPLRERADDVPVLAAHFWAQATARVGSRAVLGATAVASLARYDWPGNVRELQNALSALAVAAPRRGVVGPGLLPESIARVGGPGPRTTLEEARRGFERRYVRAALARAGGHRGRAAADLGLTRQGLAKLMDRLGVNCPGDGLRDAIDLRP